MIEILRDAVRFLRGNPAAQPVERDLPEHREFLVRAARGGVDVLFLGDSITRGWLDQPDWKNRFEPLNAANFAINGDLTGHVLWRVTAGGELDGLAPKVVVLLIGTNNLGRDGARQIAAGIKRIVEAVREKSPASKILLLGLLPRDREAGSAFRAKIAETNVLLAKLDDGAKTVRFLDLGKKFLEPDGSLASSTAPDSVHLSPRAYAIFAAALAPEIKALLS